MVRPLTFLEEQDRADAADRDAIAEYWTLTNDPTNDFTPAERDFLIDVARTCAGHIARRADTIQRSYP